MYELKNLLSCFADMTNGSDDKANKWIWYGSECNLKDTINDILINLAWPVYRCRSYWIESKRLIVVKYSLNQANPQIQVTNSQVQGTNPQTQETNSQMVVALLNSTAPQGMQISTTVLPQGSNLHYGMPLNFGAREANILFYLKKDMHLSTFVAWGPLTLEIKIFWSLQRGWLILNWWGWRHSS